MPVLMAAMAYGTGRIYGGGTTCSMPIIFVHRRRGVPRRPSRRRRPGPLPRLIISYYLKYHIRVCIRRIRTYATVCVWQGPERGRATAPPGVLSRLFPGPRTLLGPKLPRELFAHVLSFWRSVRASAEDRAFDRVRARYLPTTHGRWYSYESPPGVVQLPPFLFQ